MSFAAHRPLSLRAGFFLALAVFCLTASSAFAAEDARGKPEALSSPSVTGTEAPAQAQPAAAPATKAAPGTASPAQTASAASGGALTMKSEDDKAVTWTLTADKVSSQNDGEVVEAFGNVELRRGTEYLKADYARYYSSTKWVFLRGHVVALMGKDQMKAEEAEFDLSSRVGWLKKGEIFMDGPHIYFSGDRINKHWGDVYTFKQAKITACDGDVPAWSLLADEAVVELDGYAQLWHTRFQVADTPVAYSPWMLMPAKKDRQSGFLPPEFGQSSQRGVYYNQPYFWAIDQSRDLLLNEYVMEKHGLMQGVQYRSRPSAREGTWLRADWLSDSKRVLNDKDDPVNSDDGLIRTNDQRYWLRGMYDGELPGDPRWKLRADIDYVSDQNFLHEFKSGYSGFNQSRNQLFNLFRRDIREKDQSRESGLLLFRDWQRVTVALGAGYTQDQTLGHGNKGLTSDPTVQRLPQVSAYLHKGQIIEGFPLEISAATEAGYMYRRNGTRGARYTLTPQLTVPVNGRYGSVIASAGVRQALYATDKVDKENNKEDLQDGNSQTVPEFNVMGSTEFARVFPLKSAPLAANNGTIGQTRWTALRHAVQPRVGYANVPLEDQSRNPKYDDGDRIRATNELTYSVTNLITRKREKVVAQKAAKAGEAPTPAVATDYLDLLRLTLAQGYDIREANRDDERDRYSRRPFSDVRAEVQIGLDEYISLLSRTYWSPYMNRITRHDHGAQFAYPSWGTFYAGMGYRKALDEYTRYREDDIKTIDLRATMNFFGPLSARLAYSRDYENDTNVERTLELIYTHQCFQLIGRYSQDANDRSYQFLVVLNGLGG